MYILKYMSCAVRWVGVPALSRLKTFFSNLHKMHLAHLCRSIMDDPGQRSADKLASTRHASLFTPLTQAAASTCSISVRINAGPWASILHIISRSEHTARPLTPILCMPQLDLWWRDYPMARRGYSCKNKGIERHRVSARSELCRVVRAEGRSRTHAARCAHTR